MSGWSSAPIETYTDPKLTPKEWQDFDADKLLDSMKKIQASYRSEYKLDRPLFDGHSPLVQGCKEELFGTDAARKDFIHDYVRLDPKRLVVDCLVPPELVETETSEESEELEPVEEKEQPRNTHTFEVDRSFWQHFADIGPVVLSKGEAYQISGADGVTNLHNEGNDVTIEAEFTLLNDKYRLILDYGTATPTPEMIKANHWTTPEKKEPDDNSFTVSLGPKQRGFVTYVPLADREVRFTNFTDEDLIVTLTKEEDGRIKINNTPWNVFVSNPHTLMKLDKFDYTYK